MRAVWAGGRASGDGFSAIQMLITMAIAVVVSALAVPLTAHTVDSVRARHAAGLLATRLRLARQQAITTGRTTAVVFDTTAAGGWTIGVYQDGNGNGVRRVEVASGIDRRLVAPVELANLVPGTAIRVAGDIPGPDGEAPSARSVRFGPSQMASCTPLGGCTPGTVFVRSSRGDQFAVRLGNMTGRARVLHYEGGSGQWVTE
jgi:type II secretory pathway pseudopilin PulG